MRRPAEAVAATPFEDFCPARRRRFVLIAAVLASAMGFIDGSVVAIAVPAIRESLGASLVEVQWINNAYMLALSALILAGGAAGDRWGLRNVLSTGIAVFVAASLACAAAPDPDVLIAARVVQGIGAALMVPGSLALISKTYPAEERARAIGVWAAASALTTAAGPVLGGALLAAGGAEVWRAIFAINLPVGAVAAYLLLARVPADSARPGARMDWSGAGLATLGLGLLAWGLTGEGGEESVPGAGHVLVWGGAGLALLAVFVAQETRAAQPMMPLRLFRAPGFAAANLVTFCLYFALSAILFFLPMTLITGWGLGETEAGLVFVPLTVAVAAGSGPVGALAARTGPGPLIGAGSLLVAAAYASLAIGIGWGLFWAHVFVSLCLMGLGMALVVAPLSAAVMGGVAEGDAGAASGTNNAISRVAGLVAVAAMGGVAGGAYAAAGGPLEFGAPGDAAAHRQAMEAGFAAVAWGTALLAAAAGVLGFTAIPRPRA